MFHRRFHNQTLQILLIFFVILNFYQYIVFIQCATTDNDSNNAVTTTIENLSTTILAERFSTTIASSTSDNGTIYSTSLTEGITNTESTSKETTEISTTTELDNGTTNPQISTPSSKNPEENSTPVEPTTTTSEKPETTTAFELSEENCKDKVKIEKFNVTSSTSESLFVEWKTSKNYKNCVETVNITWVDDDDNEKFHDSNFKPGGGSWNITDLWPCRRYTIIIKLIGGEENFIVDQATKEKGTESVVPKAVELITHDPTVNSIELSWKSTTEKDKYCLTGYNITYHQTGDPEHTIEPINLLPNTTKYSIENLRPCTQYEITITSIGIDNRKGGETSEDAQTSSVAPATVKLKLTPTENTIIMEWTSDSQKGVECLKGYQISYKLHTEGNYQIIDGLVDKTENRYLLDDLLYCNEYDIEILPVGEEKNGTVAKESTTTDFTAPSAVQNFRLSTEKDTITVKWEAPINASECVVEYQISCHLESPEGNSETIIYNSKKFSHTFENLNYCSTYTIEIKPLGQEGQSGNSTSNSIETESIDMVDEVGDLKSTPHPNSIFVEWEAPSHSACVEGYKISYLAKNIVTPIEDNTTDLNFKISDLEPCIEYNITVQPIPKSEIGSKPRSTVSTTSAIKPSEVTDIQIDPQQYALNISWNPPETARHCVKKYGVKIDDTTEEFTETVTKMMRNLNACAEYNVTITPIYEKDQRGEASSPKKEKTLPSVTNAPTLIEAIVDRKSATLHYSLDLGKNFCKLETATTICNNGKQPITNYTSLNNTWTEIYTFEVEITGMTAFTEYTCSTNIKNAADGKSEEDTTYIKTKADVPSEPLIEDVIEINSNSFKIIWQNPESIPGENYSETLEIIEIGPKFYIPSDCNTSTQNNTIIPELEKGQKSYYYDQAKPYTEYTIKIFGTTEAGNGPPTYKTIVTNPSASEPVRDLNVSIIYNKDKNYSYPYDIQVKWQSPCNSSGKLQSFFVQVGENEEFSIDAVENKTSYSTSLEDLKPETNYMIQVYAQTFNSPVSSPAPWDFITPAGVPSFTKDYLNISVDPHKTNSPEHKAEIQFPQSIFGNEMGTINFYSIIISKAGFEGPQKFESWNDTGDNWVNDVEKWPNNRYQATLVRWKPLCRVGMPCNFIIGVDDCKDLNVKEQYCNGPLDPNTNYSVRIRGFTSKGFCETPSIYFQTAVSFNVGIIIAVIISLFIFGTCLSFAIYFKNGNASVWVKSIFLCKDISTSASQNTVMPPRISVQNFPAHCIMLRSNANQLSSEFSLLETLSDDIALLTYIGDLPHNRVKNRYPNIKPYDVTRVKLRVVPDEFSDYINASYIKGYSSDVEYIATQGPKEETIDDFWQMVYENDVKQIVMVTNLTEKGKSKCYKYYPEELDPVTCNNGIELECEFIEFRQAFTIRHICLKKKSNPYLIERKLIHLQFHEWPDFGVPQSTDSVLKLCREIRSHQAHNYGVVVVHCSAGVGRTGTIIAIDILVQAIHANRKIDVFGTVHNLRKQRQHMVKNEGQYAFIYSCLRDEILNPRVFQGTDRHSSSYTSFYERGYYNFYDDGDLRKLSIESAM
ncbi:phosphatidylinositol phosphatase PTPRQ [Chrysoperla carnea]|uniref:phosphatidylinositol phosphatase PTPRQ n=1 Tax=Chrysoperla carnea TaxID=189513 RepID=UPI001D095709|nr:phosphatidylinositol phosphatase PTPRQ [Chrysoperla carnea]